MSNVYCCYMYTNSKINLSSWENLYLIFDNLDLILFWPHMMSKMPFPCFLCREAQKYTFWKFALDDFWWFCSDFVLLCFFCAWKSKNAHFENLHLMTFSGTEVISTSLLCLRSFLLILKPHVFSVHGNSKIHFENLHLMALGDLDLILT